MVTISVSHDLGSFAARLSSYPRALEGAMNEATREATRHTERFFGEEMVRIAGGGYWEVDAEVTGSRGVVSTEKNRAHRIEPNKPHGLLVFEIAGQTVFIRGGVDHPGSRPVDVLSPLRRTQVPHLRGIYREKVREAMGGVPSAVGVL